MSKYSVGGNSLPVLRFFKLLLVRQLFQVTRQKFPNHRERLVSNKFMSCIVGAIASA